MSTTTDFIAELVRAANDAGKLTADERRQLVMRGARTIREMRLQTGIPPERGKDALNDLEMAARMKSETGSNDDAKTVLLDMADMIRMLKIVLDVKAADE